MEEHTCEECRHFRQHYIKCKNGDYDKTGSGHCPKPHLRRRQTYAPACPRFEAKPEDESQAS